MPGHEVYTITDEQLAEWKKSAEPLHKKWADAVRDAGGDPDAIMKELKASLAQYQRGLLMRPRDQATRAAAGGLDLRGARRIRRQRGGERMAEPTVSGSPDPAAAALPQPRSPMDWFIDGIELIAAFFVGIVAADIFISVHAALFLQRADSGQPTISAGCCSAS